MFVFMGLLKTILFLDTLIASLIRKDKIKTFRENYLIGRKTVNCCFSTPSNVESLKLRIVCFETIEYHDNNMFGYD